ncbi:MAG: RnfABCDGE type electron transport complex subunit B [Gammaproteobacteria bacterium]|nr:RnfABCDGE type electron transport complex subunit B [Gammaproteobacteria bacterium]
MSITVQQICDVLPQTQCRECGYDGCRPYATALAAGLESDITKCLPGAQPIANAIAALLNKPQQIVIKQPSHVTALLNVDRCIGCNLCVKVCPVDAIIGELNFEHQVIESDCTGCGLCVPVCPTSCLSLTDRQEDLPSQQSNYAGMARKQARELALREKRVQEYQQTICEKKS